MHGWSPEKFRKYFGNFGKAVKQHTSAQIRVLDKKLYINNGMFINSIIISSSPNADPRVLLFDFKGNKS